MNLELQIKQHGKLIHSWPSKASVALISPAMEAQADHAAAQLWRDGKMERGYYDLDLYYNGNETDHEVLIA